MIILLTEISCEKPPDLVNAITLSGATRVDFRSGAIETYECIKGKQFQKKIFRTNVTCQPNGTWSPNPLTLSCRGTLYMSNSF